MIRFPKIILIILVVAIAACQSNQTEKHAKEETIPTVSDSIEILTNMINNDSADYKLYAHRARLNLEKGLVDPAFRDLSYAIDMNPNDPDLYILLGDIYFIIGKKENCLQSYRKAAQLNPDSEEPLLKLAETYLILKEYKQALQYIEQTLGINVENAEAYYLKGIQKMETGDTTNALLNLKIAGNLDSTYYEAFMQTGGLYTAMGDSLAIDFYKAALKAIPDEERALLLLAISYQENNNFDQALSTYQKINELYPANKIAFYNTGYIYMVELMDFEQAKEAFHQAINIDHSYVEAVYNLGRIYEETGDYDLARIQYKQALELETNYPLAIEGLNRLDDRGE